MSIPYAIPTSKVLERIHFENPWWIEGLLPEALQNLPKRLYFSAFYSLLMEKQVRRAILVVGPRRVGKTVMMYQAIGELIKQGLPPRKIFFVAVDNPIFINLSLEDLFKNAIEASGSRDPADSYVFFDEIQYLRDWERHLKILVDDYPETKFIVSGSAAAALKVKSTESGAGRFSEFILPPLTFQEFLHLQDLQHLVKSSETDFEESPLLFFSAVDIKALNHQFFNYINYGGYPEVVFSEAIRKDMPRYIRNDIMDKVLLRDLPALYGLRDVRELYSFFALLAYHTGKEFAPKTLSSESEMKYTEIKNYLEYLESAFLIRILHKIDDNAKEFKRVTGYKIFLTNSSLRTALFSPVIPTDDEAGQLVETAILTQWMHHDRNNLRYAQWKLGRGEGEVDIVHVNPYKLKPKWCAEIKWTNRFIDKPGELKSLLDFSKKNNLTNAIVTSIDKEKTLEYKGMKLHFLPASVYAYMIGANTVMNTSKS